MDFAKKGITRLAIHKNIQADATKKIVLITDGAASIENYPAYAIVLGICNLIYAADNFYPSLGKIETEIQGEMINML